MCFHILSLLHFMRNKVYKIKNPFRLWPLPLYQWLRDDVASRQWLAVGHLVPVPYITLKWASRSQMCWLRDSRVCHFFVFSHELWRIKYIVSFYATFKQSRLQHCLATVFHHRGPSPHAITKLSQPSGIKARYHNVPLPAIGRTVVQILIMYTTATMTFSIRYGAFYAATTSAKRLIHLHSEFVIRKP